MTSQALFLGLILLGAEAVLLWVVVLRLGQLARLAQRSLEVDIRQQSEMLEAQQGRKPDNQPL